MDRHDRRQSHSNELTWTPLVTLATALMLAGCGDGSVSADTPNPPPPQNDDALYQDVSATNLPVGALGGLSMDAKPVDVDGDDDLDVVIANEFGPNILLLNDGSGRFSNASGRLPNDVHDSEDVGVADFNRDGRPDIVIVSEDDQTNELYFNQPDGRFSREGTRLPVTGTSNAVLVADFDGDGSPDILIGNNGQNEILINDGNGDFTRETGARLPTLEDVTQDVELGDVDGDGDLDLLVGNEDRNRLLINDGTGVFSDESEARIPLRGTPEETREADFGDIDGDGDLDILFANVNAFVAGADATNRLLVNDGTGRYTDETGDRLPDDANRSFDGDFFDLDRDGDLDIITSNANALQGAGTPYEVYLNDGSGIFTRGTADVFPSGVIGLGFDVEAADFDRDGLMDLYLASRGSADRLLLGVAR